MDSSPWRVTAASVRGTSHEKTQQPCQDSHLYAFLPNGDLAAAVADGAGTASKSEAGSKIAVEAAVHMLKQSAADAPWPVDDEGWRHLLTQALEAAREAVEAGAALLQLHPRDLATTLIVMVLTPDAVAAAQVGDGAVVVVDDAGALFAVTVPKSGEYINETTFIVSPDAVPTAQIQVWRGHARQVALFSDGLQMLALKMPEGLPHGPFFSPLFRFAEGVEDSAAGDEQLAAFLGSPKITARADDDLTLLLAVRRPPAL